VKNGKLPKALPLLNPVIETGEGALESALLETEFQYN
jgi:hypothetical protein